MKNIDVILRNIRKVNRAIKGISLEEYLLASKLSLDEFLIAIGFNPLFLSSKYGEEIRTLLKEILCESIEISFNPSMDSLDKDEISIYCKDEGFNISFLLNEVQIIQKREETIEGKTYIEVDNFGYYLEDKIAKIAFNYKLVEDSVKKNTRFITNRFPLDSIEIDVLMENDRVPYGLKVSFSSNNMLVCDYLAAINALYSFDFGRFYKILEDSEREGSSLRDNFYRKNMNNNINR